MPFFSPLENLTVPALSENCPVRLLVLTLVRPTIALVGGERKSVPLPALTIEKLAADWPLPPAREVARVRSPKVQILKFGRSFV